MVSIILSLLTWAQTVNPNFVYYQNQRPLNYKIISPTVRPIQPYQNVFQQLNPQFYSQNKNFYSYPQYKTLPDSRSQNIIQNIQIYNPYPVNNGCCGQVLAKKGILLPILPSKTKIGYLNSNIIFLADQLLRNIDVDQKKYPVIVTTFVNLNNFKETSDLGRLLKENLVHELQIRGWKVIDINYMPKVKVNKNGEFVLTRNMKKLVKKYKVASILVGTYTVAGNALIVNARIINAKNGLVISTAQFEIPLSFVESLLQNSAIKPVEIVVTGE